MSQCNSLFIENNPDNVKQILFKEIKNLKGTLIHYDSNMDSFNLFSAYLHAKGYKVYVWNPASNISHRYSPLSLSSSDNALSIIEAERIGFSMFPKTGNYWDMSARQLMIALLLYFNQYNERKVSTQHFTNLLTIADPVYDIAAVMDTKLDLHELAYQFFANFLNKPDTERTGIISYLLDKITDFFDPYVMSVTAKNDFELAKIFNGKTALFIIDDAIARPITKQIISVLNLQIAQLLKITEIKKPVKIIFNNIPGFGDKTYKDLAYLQNKISKVSIYKNQYQLTNSHGKGYAEYVSNFDQIITSNEAQLQADSKFYGVVKALGNLKSYSEYLKEEDVLPTKKPVRIPQQKLHNYQKKVEKKNNISYLYLVKDNTKNASMPNDDKPKV